MKCNHCNETITSDFYYVEEEFKVYGTCCVQTLITKSYDLKDGEHLGIDDDIQELTDILNLKSFLEGKISIIKEFINVLKDYCHKTEEPYVLEMLKSEKKQLKKYEKLKEDLE